MEDAQAAQAPLPKREDRASKPVCATAEELELVRKGLAEFERGELINVRAFLR